MTGTVVNSVSAAESDIGLQKGRGPRAEGRGRTLGPWFTREQRSGSGAALGGYRRNGCSAECVFP